MMKPTVAAFDFDKTITRCDSLLPFLISYAGAVKTFLFLAAEIPAITGFLIGIVPRQKAKERVIARFFRGVSIGKLRETGAAFAAEGLNRYVKKEALERLHWHRSQGHRCVIVSASLDIYLIPWAKAVGIDEVISSSLEIDSNDKVTGNLSGFNCWGSEKLRRLVELVGERSGYSLYAYGDSRGDKELLDSADHCYYRRME